MTTKRKPTVLDLFAGCGGLSKGFEKAGFEIIVANEFWHPATESYRRNHPNTTMIEKDITFPETEREIIETVGKSVDVIIGGPPCQAYSMAGKRDPTDPRGKLFENYVDLVRVLKPKVFVMENVKGILSMMHPRDNLTKGERENICKIRERVLRNQEAIRAAREDKKLKRELQKEIGKLREKAKKYQEKVTDMIRGRFQSLGYKTEFRVLNAADYGVPQKRERVVFIGTSFEIGITFPEPTHGNNTGQRDLFGKRLKRHKTVREAIGDLELAPENPHLHHIFPNHSPKFVEKIKRTPVGKSVFKSYSDAFYRCPPDEPSRTVKENHNGVFVHYAKDRVMTPRELARLQDFDDNFIFCGNKSVVLKQIGNAVPVGLAKATGKAVKQLLEDQGSPLSL